MKTKKQKSDLKKLGKFLVELDEAKCKKKFAFSEVFVTGKDIYHPNGTAGCPIGFMPECFPRTMSHYPNPLMKEGKGEGDKIKCKGETLDVQEFFGLSALEYTYLFMPAGHSSPISSLGRYATSKAVGRLILEFCAHGYKIPDWGFDPFLYPDALPHIPKWLLALMCRESRDDKPSLLFTYDSTTEGIEYWRHVESYCYFQIDKVMKPCKFKKELAD